MNHKIVTHHIFPPIPIRRFDWVAYFEGQEERCEYGYGSTEQEAVAELLAEYGDEYDDAAETLAGAV